MAQVHKLESDWSFQRLFPFCKRSMSFVAVDVISNKSVDRGNTTKANSNHTNPNPNEPLKEKINREKKKTKAKQNEYKYYRVLNPNH